MGPTRAMGWSDFTDAVKREIDITFNPRTRGAKIAGRCPDTQTLPNEVRNAMQQAEAEEAEATGGGDLTGGGGFNLQAFTAALEEQIAAENAAATAVDLAEQNINAELASRLAEVFDGFGNAVAAEGCLEALSVSEVGSSVATVSKSSRQQALELAYYGSDYVGEGPLSGRELALLCYSKYGKYHDMAIKHIRMGEGMKRWVSLNLYVGHLGQRSYPATEETYVEQMDSIAYMITSWGQADYCRAFFREAPVARRGLPSKPRVDTCVTLQFNRSPTWDDDLGDEFFAY